MIFIDIYQGVKFPDEIIYIYLARYKYIYEL